jgi:chemotaxis protein CheD
VSSNRKSAGWLDKSSLHEVNAFQTSSKVDLEEIYVDMAEMKVESKPVEFVSCVGSCIALCMHDASARNGGLAHVMLPQASLSPSDNLPGKFADTAVPALIKAMKRLRPDCSLTAKIAGGANMFSNIKNQSIAVGTKNIEAIKTALSASRIPLVGEDVAGTQGRKVMFNTATGTVTVRLINGLVNKI